MRVLLDNAVGAAWPSAIARPAIRHVPAPVLDRAIALGDAIQADPALLAALNRRSLAWRRLDRTPKLPL